MKKNEILPNMSSYMNKRILSGRQAGFTLIELMIVMAIIAILATAGLLAYNGSLKKSRDSVRGSIASELNTVVTSYMGSNGGRPPATHDEFKGFLRSAGALFGSSAKDIANGTIVRDPIQGKSVCLDADKKATEPCVFHYTAYTDGTYAISYGIESTSSMETNFYKTQNSTPGSNPKYGIYIGTAPYIGTAATTENSANPVDPDTVVRIAYMSPPLNSISGGGGGVELGGACGNTTCLISQGCGSDVCTDLCGGVDGQLCMEGEECTDGYCVTPTDSCDAGENPVAGTVCDDETVYVTSTLRTTPNDAPGFYKWSTQLITTGATSMDNGASNTANLATRGSTYAAAYYCKNTERTGGYEDWYLPAFNQLHVLYLNQVEIKGFTPYGHWSSTEYADFTQFAIFITFNSSGSQSGYFKTWDNSVRCVRSI